MIEIMELFLDKNPYDVEARTIIADVYEDDSNYKLARYYRWTAETNTFPCVYNNRWYYYTALDSKSAGEIKYWFDWRDFNGWRYQQPFESRREIENKFCLFLESRNYILEL